MPISVCPSVLHFQFAFNYGVPFPLNKQLDGKIINIKGKAAKEGE